MKAYVKYFDTDAARARQQTGWSDIRDGQTAVEYSRSPEYWKMGEWEARTSCEDLNRANVYPIHRPSHMCQFEVEQIRDGEFVIVCNNHPDF